MMSTPTTSFVVPCYNLAHLLGECVSSILNQSYGQFEILIVDDCSPDHTPEVASTFHDPRVRYLRNEKNLGHLRNYNHGIGLARGKYIWLISADDRLRSPDILERYVEMMETHPQIGYACCPAMRLVNGEETHVEGSISSHDTIFSGKAFARRLLEQGNLVIAASGMVRRECYERLGAFPLDLPFAGDWYMWCLFSLYHDVTYFAEPMVNYRQHERSMTNHLTGERFATRFTDGLAVLWRIRQKAETLGYIDLVKLCRHRLAYQYAHNILGRECGESRFSMSLADFESSLQKNSGDLFETDLIRARTWEIVADVCFRRRDFRRAQSYYALGRTYRGSRMMVPAKQLVLGLGAGNLVVEFKEAAGAMRRAARESDIRLIAAQHSSTHSSARIAGQGTMVSFVVPCYKLGHLLAECLDSILGQTYANLEVLIMDDCSPDHTPDVARSYDDPRVSYIRNESNLGHLRNYNKGITLSRGRYIWLISADDRLRRPYVLERYVRLMEEHPNVGYVCCPGIGLQNGEEKGRLQCGYFGARDRIFTGPKFIHTSLQCGYGLLAPSVLVRKDCYEKVSMFPTDMPHQGDWYLWFRWALECDVAYMCEPMVNYRLHDLNIMKDLVSRFPDKVFNDEVAVLWRTIANCEHKGLSGLVRACQDRLTRKYARAATSAIYRDDYAWGTGSACHWRLTPDECRRALQEGASGPSDRRRMQAWFAEYLGNQHWRHGAFNEARRSYASALKDHWRSPRVWVKLLALRVGLGHAGTFIKKALR